jgi:hypothetical protein
MCKLPYQVSCLQEQKQVLEEEEPIVEPQVHRYISKYVRSRFCSIPFDSVTNFLLN